MTRNPIMKREQISSIKKEELIKELTSLYPHLANYFPKMYKIDLIDLWCGEELRYLNEGGVFNNYIARKFNISTQEVNRLLAIYDLKENKKPNRNKEKVQNEIRSLTKYELLEPKTPHVSKLRLTLQKNSQNTDIYKFMNQFQLIKILFGKKFLELNKQGYSPTKISMMLGLYPNHVYFLLREYNSKLDKSKKGQIEQLLDKMAQKENCDKETCKRKILIESLCLNSKIKSHSFIKNFMFQDIFIENALLKRALKQKIPSIDLKNQLLESYFSKELKQIKSN